MALLVPTLLAALAAGCGHPTTTPNTPAAKTLIAPWDWYETRGGFAGVYSTPASGGCAAAPVLRAASTYVRYRNSQAVDRGMFAVRAVTEGSESGVQLLQRTAMAPEDCSSCDPLPAWVVFGAADSLTLADVGADTYTSRYVRRR